MYCSYHWCYEQQYTQPVQNYNTCIQFTYLIFCIISVVSYKCFRNHFWPRTTGTRFWQLGEVFARTMQSWNIVLQQLTFFLNNNIQPVAVLLTANSQRSMFGRRAFSVAGPAAWTSSPDYLRYPSHSFDSFHRDLKTFFSRFTSVHSALQDLRSCAIKIYFWHSHWQTTEHW